MQPNQHQHNQSYRILIERYSRISLNLHKMPYSLSEGKTQIRDEAEKEQNEKLVVPIPETIVDEGAVVVEVFDAAAANLTVKVRLSFDDFVVGAKVVQIDTFLQRLVNYIDEGSFAAFEKTRVHED